MAAIAWYVFDRPFFQNIAFLTLVHYIEQGYEGPDTIRCNSKVFTMPPSDSVAFDYDEVHVVSSDTVSDDRNTINQHESLISYANRHYGDPISFSIFEKSSGNHKQPIRSVSDGRNFEISFQRTPRMPDDNKLHQLPGSLGSYDLFNVEACADRLPLNIREAGGVFLPMWQREAMWINFEVGNDQRPTKYAIRVFLGRVNAVSGLLMDEDQRNTDSPDQKQDYVVVPGQRWLDGICVAPGVVRQFVAMPCMALLFCNSYLISGD